MPVEVVTAAAADGCPASRLLPQRGATSPPYLGLLPTTRSPSRCVCSPTLSTLRTSHPDTHTVQTRAGSVPWVSSLPATGNNILGLDAMGVRASPHTSCKNSVLGTTPAGSILSLDMQLVSISAMQRSPTSMHGSPADSVGAYSLGSDGFPRPSRRAPQQRGTIQSTTSLQRSNPSRQGSAQTHSSYASSGRAYPSRQSSMQTSRSSNSRPSLDSAKHSGSSHSRRSDDRRGRPTYTRAPSSLRTSSVPPENRTSPYGISRITDSPGQYYH